MRPCRIALGLIVVASLGPREAEAGWTGPGRRGTPPPGCPRTFEHSLDRAGGPLEVSPHAVPADTAGYSGDYVGGGSACGGSARRREEGTWGWDYSGDCLPHRVWLGWSHGRRYQGGPGSYRTDIRSPPNLHDHHHPPGNDAGR